MNKTMKKIGFILAISVVLYGAWYLGKFGRKAEETKKLKIENRIQACTDSLDKYGPILDSLKALPKETEKIIRIDEEGNPIYEFNNTKYLIDYYGQTIAVYERKLIEEKDKLRLH